MLSALKQRFTTWALRRQRYDHGAVMLSQRSIYIIPTRQGLALAFVLVLMLLGDINYNLSLGYVLTFLLATMAVMSMLHAFRNLAHLEIRAGHADAVFGGGTAQFMLHFHNRGRLPRHQLCLRNDSGSTVIFDVPAQQDSAVAFPVAATRRGWLPLGKLTLYTEFPLGLFHAWSYLHFDSRCLVYPKPLSDAPLPLGTAPDGVGKRSIAGDDDFSGLRNYVAGDALPRIDWKVFAREQGLQVKQFSSQVGEELKLDIADAPDRSDEDKLARLTRWVLDAEAQGLRYGLRLPGEEWPLRHGGAEPSGAGGAAGNGAAHRDECLRRLALFNLPQQVTP